MYSVWQKAASTLSCTMPNFMSFIDNEHIQKNDKSNLYANLLKNQPPAKYGAISLLTN